MAFIVDDLDVGVLARLSTGVLCRYPGLAVEFFRHHSTEELSAFCRGAGNFPLAIPACAANNSQQQT